MSVSVRVVASATCLAACLALDALGTQAQAATATFQDTVSELREALAFGKPSLMLRYRYEQVNLEGNPNEAHASTLRVAFGYETKPYLGVNLFGQVETVVPIGQRLYSYPGHPNQYPTVVDPTGTELNQAYLRYQYPVGNTKFSFKAGRQDVLLNNQRLIGNVAWRQNQQTFDAVTATFTPIKPLSISAGYLGRVNRITGKDTRYTGASNSIGVNDGVLRMDSTFANAGWKQAGYGALNAYAVLLQYTDLPAQSCKTVGVRLEGPWKLDADWSVVYAAEYAQQKEFANAPVNYKAGYWLAEAGLAYQIVTVKAGYNVLQGAGASDKFNTPLATGHAFNGWAELFLVTPANGLQGAYLSAASGIPWVAGLNATVIGYDFKAQSGTQHYGTELDVLIEYKVLPVDKNLLLALKLGKFKATSSSGLKDTTKLSLYNVYTF